MPQPQPQTSSQGLSASITSAGSDSIDPCVCPPRSLRVFFCFFSLTARLAFLFSFRALRPRQEAGSHSRGSRPAAGVTQRNFEVPHGALKKVSIRGTKEGDHRREEFQRKRRRGRIPLLKDARKSEGFEATKCRRKQVVSKRANKKEVLTVGSLIDPLFGPFFSIKMSVSKSFIQGRKTTMWLCSAFSALLVRPANRLLSRLPLLIATDNTVFALWHLCQSVYKEPSELPGFLPYNARRVYTRGCRAGAPV